MHLTRTILRLINIAVVTALLALPAFALDLDAAKADGLVGETSTGYIAAVKPSADVDALVSSINSQRKVYYQEIATKNGISLQAVEVRAGQKAIEKTTTGNYINNGTGWQKK
jgi:uncharacterized protein YdbL (DUF1318 family)